MANWEGIIWTERGAWLQTTGPDGRVRLSDCGRLSLASVEMFCGEHNLALDIFDGEGLHRVRDQDRPGWRCPVAATT